MRFWTKIFAVSFAMGVVSGIVLSYQFGTNWSRFSVVAGNVVGPLIGYEVLTAFFLEATFLGILLFGFNRVPPWLYVLSAAIVAIGTAMSAFWILSANSWMQTPVGHEMRDGIAYPVDWLAIIFNPSFPYRFAHMLNAAYLTTGFVVLAVGARYLLAGQVHRGSAHDDADGDRAAGDPRAAAAFHRRPARAEHAQASADQDRRHGRPLGRQQARRFLLFAWPDEKAEKNRFEISIPRGASLILTHDPNGLFPGPEERAGLRNGRRCRSVFFAFRIMLGDRLLHDRGGACSARCCGGAEHCSRRAGICASSRSPGGPASSR